MPTLTAFSPTVAVIDGFAAQFYVDFGRRLQKAARLNGNGLDPRLEDAINSLEHAATEWARRGGHKPATPEVPSSLARFCSTTEAARHLNVSQATVTRMARSGKLGRSTLSGRGWAIDTDSLVQVAS